MILFREESMVKAIRYGIYAVLFVPLTVIPWLFFPFAASRGFLFQIIVEMLFALYLPLALNNPAFRPKKTPILYALSFLFCALLLSTLFGLDTYRSFWGNYERMWGFFQLAHFFLFFIILIGVFKTNEQWQKLIKIALIAGGLAALSGLVQFLYAFAAGGEMPRIAGIIGNPAFLAAYLLFPLFFSLYSFHSNTKDGPWYLRYRYLALSGGALFVMLMTGTRGAFMALAATAICAAILFLIFCRSRALRIASAIFLTAVVFGAFSVVRHGSLFEKPARISEDAFYSLAHFDAPPSAVPRSGFLSRLTDLSIYDTTTLTRLATWKTVLASAKDYPVFGVGAEHFILAFNKYFNPQFYTAERSEIWFDRSHNAFIDALVMYGAFGFVAYLSLFTACFFMVFRLYRRGAIDPAHTFVLVLFFIAYAAQNFFLFDSFAAFLMFVFVIAYVHSISTTKESPLYKGDSFVAPSFFIALFATALLVGYLFSVRPLMQGYLLAKAESSRFNIDASMALYEKALSWRTFGDNETRSRLALAVARAVQRTEMETLPENLSRYLDRAIAALKENITQSNQYHLLYRLQLSDVYNLKLSRGGGASKEIEDIVEKSIAISPGRMEFEFALAQTAFLKNEHQKAILILESASKKNQDHPIPYWKMAQNYHFMSEDAKGIPLVEKAFYLGFTARNYKELQWVAEYYNAKKDYEKIVFFNKKITELDPKLVWPHMNLAIAYQALGKNDKARNHSLQVGALDPSQKDAADNFLRELK